MRGGLPDSIHTIFDSSCTSLELECFIYVTIFSKALTRWHTLSKGGNIIIKCRVFFTTPSSRWWSCINLSRITFHGTHSLQMKSSLPHLFIMSRASLHHLILPYPLPHLSLLFMHHHLVICLHLMLILLLHHSVILHHHHIMILKHQAVKGTLR